MGANTRMPRTSHSYAPADFQVLPDEDFGRTVAPTYQWDEDSDKPPNCFSCNSHFGSSGLIFRRKNNQSSCPLCEGIFCSQCLYCIVEAPKLFDSPQNVCSVCFARMKERQKARKRQQRDDAKIKAAAAKAKMPTISGPTEAAPATQKHSLPAQETIERSLEKFMEETNVPMASRDKIRSFSPEKQWELIMSYQVQRNLSQTVDAPSLHVKKLKEPTVDSARSLRVTLSNASLSWLQTFLGLDGEEELITQFLTILRKPSKKKTKADHAILEEFVFCLFAIGNVHCGLKALLAVPSFIQGVIEALLYFGERERIKLQELLAGMALVSEPARAAIMEQVETFLPSLLDQL